MAGSGEFGDDSGFLEVSSDEEGSTKKKQKPLTAFCDDIGAILVAIDNKPDIPDSETDEAYLRAKESLLVIANFIRTAESQGNILSISAFRQLPIRKTMMAANEMNNNQTSSMSDVEKRLPAIGGIASVTLAYEYAKLLMDLANGVYQSKHKVINSMIAEGPEKAIEQSVLSFALKSSISLMLTLARRLGFNVESSGSVELQSSASKLFEKVHSSGFTKVKLDISKETTEGDKVEEINQREKIPTSTSETSEEASRQAVRKAFKQRSDPKKDKEAKMEEGEGYDLVNPLSEWEIFHDQCLDLLSRLLKLGSTPEVLSDNLKFHVNQLEQLLRELIAEKNQEQSFGKDTQEKSFSNRLAGLRSNYFKDKLPRRISPFARHRTLNNIYDDTKKLLNEYKELPKPTAESPGFSTLSKSSKNRS